MEKATMKQKAVGGATDFAVTWTPYFLISFVTGFGFLGILAGLSAFTVNNIIAPAVFKQTLGTAVSGQKMLSRSGGKPTMKQTATAQAMYPVAWLVSPFLFLLCVAGTGVARNLADITVQPSGSELTYRPTYEL